MTSSVADNDRPAGITLPMWALGIIGTVLTASAAWVSSSFFSLAMTPSAWGSGFEVVERDLRKAEVDSKGTPASLASMSSDIKSIKESMADLRDEVPTAVDCPEGPMMTNVVNLAAWKAARDPAPLEWWVVDGMCQ